MSLAVTISVVIPQLVSMKINKTLPFLGFLLSAFFIYLAFSQVQWSAFVHALTSIQPAWLILAATSLFIAMFLRSVRWHFVSGLPKTDMLNVWEATCVGYLGAVIYPARAGDVLRMLRLQQLTNLGGGLAIGSAIIDRILDGLALCIMLLMLIYSWGEELEDQKSLFLIACLFLIAAIAMVIFVVNGHRLKSLVTRFATTGKLALRISHWHNQCLDGLQVLRSSQKILRVLLLQVLVSLFDLLTCWFLLYSFGWNLPLLVSMVVLVYLAAATSLPAAPGFVGMYQIAALHALKPSGIDGSEAVAYGTILQALTLVLFVSVGIWAYFKKKTRDRLL